MNTSKEIFEQRINYRCKDSGCVCLKAIKYMRYALEILEGQHPGYFDDYTDLIIKEDDE